MMQYRLDDLGWYQFEWLVQALLKAELGLGVESWSSTRGDRGRDAYFDGELAFPTNTPNEGPFIFQVKFIEGASAKGDAASSALTSAVRKEVARIRARENAALNRWETPAHYALLTNAPLDPDTRTKVKDIVEGALPETRVTVLGGTDIGNSLDRHPELRRSFPQLLSLRDLNTLLAEAVSHDLIERSRAAIDASREIVRAFVPTSAYERALNVLRTNHFAVLYGPPEMGKSAIAWMVALAQLSQEWDAFLCQSPSEFFKLYEKDRSQIFVADDAFGHTEYDPASTLLWERDLGYVFSRLDQKHWLVLTSRRHLLERARQGMDLRGAVSRFPSPAAVLIEAGRLSALEKALILYRHARASIHDPAGLELVREHAFQIVHNPSFTPERIRRFVVDRLPELLASGFDSEQLDHEIAEAIRNPTHGMKLAFKALKEPYKWFLISLLEGGNWAYSENVRAYYDEHCPSDGKVAFDDIQDQLLEAFVRWANEKNKILTWIHPSCRDLVIDELVADEHLRQRFLATASVEGLKLAVSLMGGAEGKRRLPLLTDEASWVLFEERALAIMPIVAPNQAAALLTSLSATLRAETDGPSGGQLRRVLRVVCDEVRRVWDERERELEADEFSAFSAATLLLDPLPALPAFGPSWKAATRSLELHLAEAEKREYLDPDPLSGWVEMAKTISTSQPRFLTQASFPNRFEKEIDLWLEIATDELQADWSDLDWSELRSEASRIVEVSSALEELAVVAPDYGERCRDVAARLSRRAQDLEERATEEEPPEPEDVHDEARTSLGDTLDIRLIFSDL